MTQYLGVVQFVVGLLLTGYIIYSIEQAWSRAKTRRQYEEAFAKYHQANIKLQREDPRVPDGIIRVEAIRCGHRYAIIGAEDRYSGYVLRDDELNRTLFGIILKFQRERTSSSEDVEMHNQEVKVDHKGD